jgi:hypothetical protein
MESKNFTKFWEKMPILDFLLSMNPAVYTPTKNWVINIFKLNIDD